MDTSYQTLIQKAIILFNLFAQSVEGRALQVLMNVVDSKKNLRLLPDRGEDGWQWHPQKLHNDGFAMDPTTETELNTMNSTGRGGLGWDLRRSP